LKWLTFFWKRVKGKFICYEEFACVETTILIFKKVKADAGCAGVEL